MQIIRTSQLNWYNFENPTADDIEYLRKNFNFHPLDLEDCLSPAQRPKFDEYPNYFFLILIFPFFNKETQQIEPLEIDIFASNDYLITLYDKKLAPLSNFFNSCLISEEAKTKYLLQGTNFLLYQILEKLLLHCFPLLDYITKNIKLIHKSVFLGKQREMVQDILINKQNIVNIRTFMKIQKIVLVKLKEKQSQFNIYFQNLIEEVENIWDILESQKETIEAIENSNNAFLSYQLNQVMKSLTIISVVLLPLGLIGNILGMNIDMPSFLNLPYSFWFILIFMFVLAGFIYLIFKKKRWL